jgi:uncharacterized protein DUF3592
MSESACLRQSSATLARMGGLVLDIYVEYIIRQVALLVRIVRSRNWPVTKASVTASACARAGYGCDVAEVYYKYRVDGELYTGVYEKPFLIHNSAENYINNSVPVGADLVVRLKPGDPSTSIVLERG